MVGAFSDPAAVQHYIERTRRAVPGFDVMQQLVEQILAESVPDDGRVLVVGAGGGLELANLADHHDHWVLDGVDPSGPMLELAKTTMGSLSTRATLHEGYVTNAPDGPFDAATCLLTLHFIPRDERLETLREIRRRLRPGAPLLTFHHSAPVDARITWLERFFLRSASGPDIDSEQIRKGGQSLATHLPILSPEEDQDLLHEAGFTSPELFYAALSLRGWVAYA